jgi:hypothetical protein
MHGIESSNIRSVCSTVGGRCRENKKSVACNSLQYKMYYLTAYAYMFTELYCNMKSDMLIFQTCPPEMVNEIDEDFMR